MTGECKKCHGPDNDQMVACDECSSWYHFACVGESPGVAKRPFCCSECTEARKKKNKKTSKVDSAKLLEPRDKKAVSLTGASSSKSVTSKIHASETCQKKTAKQSKPLEESDAKSVVTHSSRTSRSRLELEFNRMAEELVLREKQLQDEKAIKDKKLEIDRFFLQKKLAQEKELREKELAQEKELLEQQLKDHIEFRDRQRLLRERFQKEKYEILSANLDEEGAVGGDIGDTLPGEDEEQDNEHKVQDWLNKEGNQKIHKRHPKVPEVPSVVTSNRTKESSKISCKRRDDSSSDSLEASNSEGEQFDRESDHSKIPGRHYGPTKAQRAARQILSKRLPIFTGKLEEWPLFYSSFVNSTEACGFSHIENLVRLQECLKGPALEAVRSRLLLPQAVPRVIETLRMLYGRPEQLIHTLLNKVRKTDSPRADRLETFIPFGIAVQELCDYLEAARFHDHLVNPLLIQELVDKLPAPTKREWVQFKRFEKPVTLRTFAQFTSKLVAEASEVTLVMDTKTKSAKGRGNEKGFVSTHSGEQSVPSVKRSSQCRICQKGDHRVRNCEDYRRLNLAERVRIMNQQKLCERCLNEHEGWCRFKITCNVGECRQHHHPLVHRERSSGSSNHHPALAPTNGINCAHVNTSVSIIFRIVPVTLFNGTRSLNTLAYLDEGSSLTLIEQSLIRDLRASGISQPLKLRWTGNIVRQEPNSECVSLEISGLDKGQRFDLKEAHTVERLCLPKQKINLREIIRQHHHLNGVDTADLTGAQPKLLIGLDNAYLLAPLESRVGNPDEPIGVRSHLGWSVYGPRQTTTSDAYIGHHDECSNEDLHKLMRKYFMIEEQEGTVHQLPESDVDRRAREIMQKTTIKLDGFYETGLVWRLDDFSFPDSLPMALQRLRSLERRLNKNPTLDQRVRQQIQEYQDKKYIHKVTAEELANANPARVWYLPINVVLNPKKPDKVRLVWDAAAQVQGVSLNSMLLAGPDLLVPLPAVLQPFREREVGFGGDLKEMFHRYKIRDADKQAQRFVFRTNREGQPEIFIMDVGTFGASCSPASAQYIKNHNASQYAEHFPEASRAIIRQHYVDDYLDSADTVEEAVERARQVRFIHSQAGFIVHKWISNSQVFLEEIGERESVDKVSLHLDEEAVERVLGLIWWPKEDVFMFSTAVRENLSPYLLASDRPTKRIALSCIMSLFDPLGLLAPFTLHGKILLQDLWRSGCGWDQHINDDCFEKWTWWRKSLSGVEKLKIPRCYLKGAPPSAYDTVQLHVFCDASSQAYGCAAYFRLETRFGIVCSLVMAKTKVAPLKQLSIPRMELQAAVLGARLSNTVVANHKIKISKRILWSDSKTVLSWIQSDQRRYKPFVGFRIGEILQETSVDEWRYIRTKMNIADIITKKRKESTLTSDGAWFRGPKILYSPEANWTTINELSPDTPEELRACHLFHGAELSLGSIIDVTRISRWNVLLRTVACVLRFISNCRLKQLGKPLEAVPTTENVSKFIRRTESSIIMPLKQEEYEVAENILWKLAQRDVFGDEITTLLRNQQSPKEDWMTIEKKSTLFKLGPFLDEHQVLRVDGRLSEAEHIPYDTRFPIILPKDHPVTNRLLEHYHQLFGHAYKDTVVAEIRRRFYIPKIRTCVAKIIGSCQSCKVRKTKPQTPRMAPLPVERITPFVRPFSYVGIDYFGPIEVVVGRHLEKRWIVLFTCFSVRAVHLEVAYKLDTASCIMAIRRFVLRRGPPITIFSDNGSNLKAANKELQEQIKRIDLASANVFTNARTSWRFSPPSAPNMGGVWERMARSVKQVMSELNVGRRMNDEILLTVIAEAEEIVNSRPLVYTSQDSESAETLTPNSYLRGITSCLQNPAIPPTDQAEALRNSYKRSQFIADGLWERWIKEYLPTLNYRSKWLEEHKPLEPGDLVFIVDDHGRNGWIRGKIETVIIGKDKRIRQAMVRTAQGLYRRPVNKLAVIEVASSCKSVPEASSGQGLRAGELLQPLGTNDGRLTDVMRGTLRRNVN
ncbi:uncharacterized protein LOC129772855 [Toxorhynchites rutilus septentrionalis]|uniref:uncharacterized protein LOC129772855 n=1 Tax=Toxorhynchites rutilus septentrionalis TaxID=329112 RepID=UPI002479C23A|nr:uncharacterized protein LOC129772855 [Toxorhynchites rutilus septentrionalis]